MKQFLGAAALAISVGALLFVSTAQHAAVLVSHDEDESRDPQLQSSPSMTFSSEDVSVSVHHDNDGTAAYSNDTETSTSNWKARQLRQQRRRQLQSSAAGDDANNINIDCSAKNKPPQSFSTPPQLPAIPLLQQSYYAASFPGTVDKLLSKTLVEQLTGLHVGNASTSPSLHKMTALDQYNMLGQGEVIALRTHFPHPKGKLSSWDEGINKAYVILRNPLDVMAEYFDEVYRNSHHLLGPSSRSSKSSNEENKEQCPI